MKQPQGVFVVEPITIIIVWVNPSVGVNEYVIDFGEKPFAVLRPTCTQNTGDLANVRFTVGDGETLPFPDAAFDLIVAADCMPFVVRAGDIAVERLFADFRRVLRPGGDLLLFNWSYRGDPQRDIGDAYHQAQMHRLALLRAGERPFAMWDGTGFHFQRPV